MIAVLSHVAAFSVGFAFAAWMIRTAVDDPEGGAGGPSSSPRGAGSPTRSSLRVVGGSTAGTQPSRRGCREACARGRAGAAHEDRRPPPGGSSAA